jgi:hypothetical protein
MEEGVYEAGLWMYELFLIQKVIGKLGAVVAWKEPIKK